jgi:hypothetical protein
VTGLSLLMISLPRESSVTSSFRASAVVIVSFYVVVLFIPARLWASKRAPASISLSDAA